MKSFIMKITEVLKKFFVSDKEAEITNQEVSDIQKDIDAMLKIEDISKRICHLIDCKRTALRWLDRSKDNRVVYFGILKEIERLDRQLDQLLVYYSEQVYSEAKMFHDVIRIETTNTDPR